MSLYVSMNTAIADKNPKYPLNDDSAYKLRQRAVQLVYTNVQAAIKAAEESLSYNVNQGATAFAELSLCLVDYDNEKSKELIIRAFNLNNSFRLGNEFVVLTHRRIVARL